MVSMKHEGLVAWGSARERLLALTREELTVRLGLTPDELDSMLRLVCSQLDVSLRQLMTD